MASLLFFVRTSTSKKEKPVSIRVRLKDEGRQAYAKTHLTIPARFWLENGRTLRSKISSSGDFKERDWCKNQLEGLNSHILNEYLKNGEPTNEWLTECIERFANPAKFETKPVTLFEFIDHFIKQAENAINPKTGQPLSLRVRRDYKTTFDHIKAFAGNRKIDFDDIDMDFYGGFVKYLETVPKVNGKPYKANTVGKFIKNLKVFLNKATEEGINKSKRYKSRNFVKIQVDADNIYLDDGDLAKLQNLDLSEKPHLEKVRDLFLVGCWTGLRFGDLTRIRPENIKDGRITIKQSKTKDDVVIPLHQVVISILEKYEGSLPPAISNQKTNNALKVIAQMAGIEGYKTITETRGGIERAIKKNRFELISTHTARRSFATNLYKSGFPSQSIMKITGHKSESAFLKYIKVTPEEHAQLLSNHWAQSGTHLKVV